MPIIYTGIEQSLETIRSEVYVQGTQDQRRHADTENRFDTRKLRNS